MSVANSRYRKLLVAVKILLRFFWKSKLTIHQEFCCRFLHLGGKFDQIGPQFGGWYPALMDTTANDRHRCDRFSKIGPASEGIRASF